MNSLRAVIVVVEVVVVVVVGVAVIEVSDSILILAVVTGCFRKLHIISLTFTVSSIVRSNSRHLD